MSGDVPTFTAKPNGHPEAGSVPRLDADRTKFAKQHEDLIQNVSEAIFFTIYCKNISFLLISKNMVFIVVWRLLQKIMFFEISKIELFGNILKYFEK